MLKLTATQERIVQRIKERPLHQFFQLCAELEPGDNIFILQSTLDDFWDYAEAFPETAKNLLKLYKINVHVKRVLALICSTRHKIGERRNIAAANNLCSPETRLEVTSLGGKPFYILYLHKREILGKRATGVVIDEWHMIEPTTFAIGALAEDE